MEINFVRLTGEIDCLGRGLGDTFSRRLFGAVVGVPVRPTGTKTLVQKTANFQHRNVER